MGVYMNSNVNFICADDETAWGQPFVDGINNSDRIEVAGAGKDEYENGVPVHKAEIQDEGRTMTLSSVTLH